MTTKTASTSDFVAIMEEMRIHSKKRIANPSVGLFDPSSKVKDTYYSMRALPLPVSNDDAIDDALAKIKQDAGTGANTTSDGCNSDINGISSDYKAQVDANPKDTTQASTDFTTKMNASRDKAKKNADDTIDAAYDKGIALGTNLPKAQQNAIFTTMNTITEGLTTVVSEIAGFVLNAVNTLVGWLKDCWKTITDTFNKIKNFITSIF